MVFEGLAAALRAQVAQPLREDLAHGVLVVAIRKLRKQVVQAIKVMDLVLKASRSKRHSKSKEAANQSVLTSADAHKLLLESFKLRPHAHHDLKALIPVHDIGRDGGKLS